MADDPNQQRQAWNHDAGRMETIQEQRWRDLRERLDDMRRDFRERLDEIRGAMNSRLGGLEKEIGELRAGKADKGDVAPRWVQTVVGGLIGLIVVGFFTALISMVYDKTAVPGQEPSRPAASSRP